MTTITIGQVKEIQFTVIAKMAFQALKSFWETRGAPHHPLVLDPQALGELSVKPEEVEANLRQPAWRNIGRYL